MRGPLLLQLNLAFDNNQVICADRSAAEDADGGSDAQHVILSASATAARLLGTSQSSLLGADLRQVLCDLRNRRSIDGWQSLEQQLEAQQEGAVQLPVPPNTASGFGRSGDAGGPPRWMDVSVTALPGGRYAWACNTCAAPGAVVTTVPAIVASPAATASPVAAQLQHSQLSPRMQAQPTPWRLSSVEAAALRALPMPVWVCDPRGRCLLANAAFCQLAGCSEGDAAGRPWTQLLARPAHPEDARAVQQVEAAIAVGQPVTAEVRRREAATRGSGDGGSTAGTVAGGPPARSWFGTITVSPLQEPGSADDGSSTGCAPLLVCTLTGGPTEAPGAGHKSADAAAAVEAGKGFQPAPPALAQLCNQALASTSEGVVITDPCQPGNPIVWANAAFERMTGAAAAAQLVLPRRWPRSLSV